VKEVNRSYIDLHADASVVGKEALIFQYVDREVTVSGYDTDDEKSLLKTVSEVLGYVIPGMGKIVILIVHLGIYLPQLQHNFLSTMKMRLHDVVVNKTPKFQCLEPTDLSHNISMRGYNVNDVLIIPLDLNGVVSCFPTCKATQEEFYTCDRYELTYESPEYYP
jgi:hypothetical protein